VPLTVNVHVTPLAVGSFCIVARNWARKKEEFRVPAASSVTLFRIVTTVAGTVMTIDADFDGSSTDVAVTVTARSEGIEAGALYVAESIV